MSAKAKKIAITLCRVLLGLLFVFSGFTKGVDPMGTALKLGEYYNAMGLDFLHGTENVFSIALSSCETALGLLLIFGIWQRMAATAVALFMFGFTLFTLYIAIANPVSDCGCFGDAIKLSNWGTFFKNALLLLPLSVVVLVNAWVSIPRPWNRWDVVWTLVFLAVPSTISVWGLCHLPLIDFLPYKVGLNISRAMQEESAGVGETRLLYRDLQSGSVVEFSLSDTTWYDTTRWEYVDTVVAPEARTQGRTVRDFAILDAGNDVTSRIITRPGTLLMLCITDPAVLDPQCFKALEGVANEALGSHHEVIALTPAPLTPDQTIFQNVKLYNMDDVTLKSLLRAKNGLVTLQNGTITSKLNCRDIDSL